MSMGYNEVITLVGYTERVDRHGLVKRTEETEDVFAQVRSIGQSEFYQAAASGLKPEIKFVIADFWDYDNQKELIYNGVRYNVLRTYRTGNALEITAAGLDV